MTPLVRANVLLAALLAAHSADHALNQPPREYGLALTVPGILGFVIVGVALALALLRSPLAAPAALAVGVSTIVGLVAIHLLPRWSAFSDPYSALSLNALSWALVVLPMAAAALLALAGLREMGGRPAPGRVA